MSDLLLLLHFCVLGSGLTNDGYVDALAEKIADDIKKDPVVV